MHSQFLAIKSSRKSADLLENEINQKHGPESWEAITRLASFIDADRLTDLQLKCSDPGVHSMHVSSSSHTSVRELEAPDPIKLVMELMKLFNSRSGSEISSRSTLGAFLIDSSLGISRNSGMVALDSESWGSNAGARIRLLNPHSMRVL